MALMTRPLRRRCTVTPLYKASIARFSLLLLFAFCLLDKATASGAQEPAPRKHKAGSITGHITIQNKLASGLEIGLFPEFSPTGKVVATTRTDAGGRYQFTDLTSDRYRIRAISPEYVNPDSGNGPWSGKIISLADGESVEDADLDLIPCGVVSGRITDSAGNPVSGEPVELTVISKYGPATRPVSLPAGPFKTDANGAFRISGIPPGPYLVSLGIDLDRITGEVITRYDNDGPYGRIIDDHYYEQTFYPSVTKREKAQPVQVVAGGEATDINITIGKALPTYTASGRVIDAQTGKPVVNCLIAVTQRIHDGYRSGGPTGIWDEQPDSTDANGYFHLSGFVPGRFFINASFLQSETGLYSSRVDFEIKDEDIKGLEIKAHHGHALEGMIIIEGEKNDAALSLVPTVGIRGSYSPLTNNAIGLVDTFRNAAVGPDGHFSIGGLKRGDLAISAWPVMQGRDFSIVRVEMPAPEDQSQMQALPIDTLGEVHLQMGDQDLKGVRITLAYNDSVIKGHVTVTSERLPDNHSLHVGISHAKRTGGGMVSTQDVDANGDFIMNNLESGDYKISIEDEHNRPIETKTINVKHHAQAQVSFSIDLSGKDEK